MRTHITQTLATLLLASFLVCPARADFYPIPIIKKMKNVVTVAKSGGQYTDVKTAIDAISDATADNPYTVFIGPGVYTVTSPIDLKAHVTVLGSGREATILRGAISSSSSMASSDSAIVVGANNATLTRLSVENTGGRDHSVGIYNDSASPVLDNISATASGSVYTFGVLNNNSSSPTMTNVKATAGTGSYYNVGVGNYNSSSPTMTGVTATASGGSYSCGVENNNSSSPTMINVTATGTGGSDNNRGVSNYYSSPTMTNVTASASGGTTNYNYGVLNSGSSPVIRHCTLEGTTAGVYGGTVVLSTVIGGGAGSAVCSSCLDGSDAALDATCN